MRVRALVVVLAVLPLPNILPAAAAPGPHDLLLALDGAPSPALAAALDGLGVAVLERFDFVHVLLVRSPVQAPALAALPGVVRVVPDEPLTSTLDSSKPVVGAGAAIAAAGFDGRGVTVAVVDSGVDERHPGLAGRVAGQYTFDSSGARRSTSDASGHGTHVAGIIAGDGSGAPGRDMSGVAPAASILSLDLSPSFTTSNAMRAFQWLHDHADEHDVKVVTNSWGRERDPVEYDADDPLIRASNALVGDGLVLVYSAGNGGPDPGRMTLEASNPNVITVGAIGDDGRVETYSSRGPVREGGGTARWWKPDLVAPGTRIESARAGGGHGNAYIMMNGTSMSAPHVAGIAAVLLQVAPDLGPGQLQRLLWATARDVGAGGPDAASGYGIADLHEAIERVQAARAGTAVKVDEWRSDGPVQGLGAETLRLAGTDLENAGRFGFEVEPGAVRAAVHVNYTGTGEVRVTLVDPAGARTVRRTDAGTWFTIEDPAPGRYAVAVEPAGPARGSYDAHATVVWLESVAALPLPPAPPRPRASFPATGVPGPMTTFTMPGLALPVPLLVPMGTLAALAAVFVVGHVRRRR